MFVLPTYSENFGIVVAEALACGTPVLTTKGTPWAELESEHCGWWIDLNKSSMVKALLSFLECTENELESMGQKGRKLVEAKYSTGKIAMDMMNLYRKVINGS